MGRHRYFSSCGLAAAEPLERCTQSLQLLQYRPIAEPEKIQQDDVDNREDHSQRQGAWIPSFGKDLPEGKDLEKTFQRGRIMIKPPTSKNGSSGKPK
jgi:hypothetical protein